MNKIMQRYKCMDINKELTMIINNYESKIKKRSDDYEYFKIIDKNKILY